MTLIKVTLPEHSRVVLLEDSEMRIAWFQKRIPNLHVCKSVKEFIEYFDTKPLVDFFFLDHDLGDGGTGVEAAQFIKDRFGGNSEFLVIHSWNRPGAAAMQNILAGGVHIPWGSFEITFE